MNATTKFSVQGMTCASCAQSIARQLGKRGVTDVTIDFHSGEVVVGDAAGMKAEDVIEEINKLGFVAQLWREQQSEKKVPFFSRLEGQFLLCALLTLPLLAHMVLHVPLFHAAWFQCLLATPVVVLGLRHFGKSAIGSIRAGSPNMDVLIATGSTTAYLYSILNWHFTPLAPELYFETAATIITLVLLGNLIERRSLRKTLIALEELTRMQPRNCHLIEGAFTDKESVRDIPSSQLRNNDLVLVNTGERIPADGQIYWGEATIDESMMSGESLPVDKGENATVLAGTIVLSGSIKFFVQQAGEATVLSSMIELIRKSAQRKPQIQRTGDVISAWFVPVVFLLSLTTFLVGHYYFDVSLAGAVMRAIAVLVISCPCAMGLATPTAVAVGIGRAARNGILVRGGDTLERLAGIQVIVFDKTGTLTKGKMRVSHIDYKGEVDTVRYLLYTLEQHSAHPIALCISTNFADALPVQDIRFSQVNELKGLGVEATDTAGNSYKAGSWKIAMQADISDDYQVYLYKNDKLLARVAVEDELREDAKETVAYFRNKGIRTILLSGDTQKRAEVIANAVGIDTAIGGQSPLEKTVFIRKVQEENSVAMIGDGINDAPSLALAHVGISVGSGMQITLDTSDIVLLESGGRGTLIRAHQLSVATIRTIKQNLLWALLYNVIAIPMAALGAVSPMLSSLSMAFSDVVVIGNSLRLRVSAIFTSS